VDLARGGGLSPPSLPLLVLMKSVERERAPRKERSDRSGRRQVTHVIEFAFINTFMSFMFLISHLPTQYIYTIKLYSICILIVVVIEFFKYI
jgi:hypothetical protein